MILFLQIHKCIINTNIFKYISRENYLITYDFSYIILYSIQNKGFWTANRKHTSIP